MCVAYAFGGKNLSNQIRHPWPCRFQIPTEKYIPEKNVFCWNDIGQIREEKKLEIPQWPAKLIRPAWLDWLCWLAGNSKGHRGISKMFSPTCV